LPSKKPVSIPEQKAICTSRKIMVGDGREEEKESNYGRK
jgi:hypothetical protein